MTAYRDKLLNSAVAYAEAGWPVFPLRPGTKRPAAPNHTEATCDQSDQRCWNGHVGWEPRATTDLERITRAWHQRPYGIAIACGPAGLLVVDLDTAKPHQPTTGVETLAQLERDHGDRLPPTWTVGTPSGGRHLYYLQPDNHRLGNTTGRAGPGIDTRGHGGYVAAPPATARNGDYWLVDDHTPVPLPDWFCQILAPAPPPKRRRTTPKPATRPDNDQLRRYVQRAVDGELKRITNAPPGQRNHSLYRASAAIGQLVGAEAIDHAEAEEVLEAAAATHYHHPPDDPLTRSEARQTITSGLRRGATTPRHLPTNLTTTGANR